MENKMTIEDIMKKLNQLGWTEELRDAVGDVKGAGGYLGPSSNQEKEYDALMSDPKIVALVKAYSEARKAEYSLEQGQHGSLSRSAVEKYTARTDGRPRERR